MLKKLKSSVSLKISTGYAFILICISVVAIYSLVSLRDSRELDVIVTDLYLPLLNKMEQIDNLNVNSRKLTNSWIYNPNVLDKTELNELQQDLAPPLIEEIRSLIPQSSNFDSLGYFLTILENVLANERQVMEVFQTKEDYDDAETLFFAIPLYDDEIAPGSRGFSEGISRLKTVYDTGGTKFNSGQV